MSVVGEDIRLRQEDKEVDGPDIEKAEERKRETELVEEREDELYDLDGLPESTLDGERSTAVLTAMKQILAGDQLIINDLKLPKRQLVALESLKAAVEGKDPRLARFVYAEDRRTLLEQALAVLQPELASLQGAGDQFQDMISKVGTLREKLNVLEDAEEELIEGRAHDAVKTEGDTDDKPDNSDLDDPKKKEPAGKKKPKKPAGEAADLSLDGPERPVEKLPTQLTGAEIKEASKGPTTLEGPAIKDAPKGPTTLEGPAIKEAPKGATTLVGAEVKPDLKGPTTLGDPEEISRAADSDTPRWRRSGG